MEDYIKCELIGRVSPRYLNTFSNLYIVTVYYTHIIHAMYYCYCWQYPHTPCCPLQTNQNIPCIYAIVDGSHVRYIGLGNISQENSTADILVENQLWPPLDMTVDQEQELHKREPQTKKNFMGFFPVLPVYYLSEGFKAHLLLRSCPMSFAWDRLCLGMFSWSASLMKINKGST